MIHGLTHESINNPLSLASSIEAEERPQIRGERERASDSFAMLNDQVREGEREIDFHAFACRFLLFLSLYLLRSPVAMSSEPLPLSLSLTEEPDTVAAASKGVAQGAVSLAGES